MRATQGHCSSPQRSTAPALAMPADPYALELVDALYREKYGSHYPRSLIRP